jgi:hypothetical protein
VLCNFVTEHNREKESPGREKIKLKRHKQMLGSEEKDKIYVPKLLSLCVRRNKNNLKRGGNKE